MQDELPPPDEHGMPGVVTALGARHDGERGRQQVDDLPLPSSPHCAPTTARFLLSVIATAQQFIIAEPRLARPAGPFTAIDKAPRGSLRSCSCALTGALGVCRRHGVLHGTVLRCRLLACSGAPANRTTRRRRTRCRTVPHSGSARRLRQRPHFAAAPRSAAPGAARRQPVHRRRTRCVHARGLPRRR